MPIFDVRYSWCSKRLFDNSLDKTKLTIDDMIPMESSHNHDGKSNVKWQPRLIVGHNVGFDRTYLREQYYIKVNIFSFFILLIFSISVHHFLHCLFFVFSYFFLSHLHIVIVSEILS